MYKVEDGYIMVHKKISKINILEYKIYLVNFLLFSLISTNLAMYVGFMVNRRAASAFFYGGVGG